MPVSSSLQEPARVDEPQAGQDYADVLTRVAAEGRPVIVRRNGEDLAAVIPLEHLEIAQEAIARRELEERAARIEWAPLVAARRPPQEWLDDTDNPFEPEEGPAS